MRAIIQVVNQSSVTLLKENKKESINKGLNILVGFNHEDNKEVVDKVAKKIAAMRIFVDENDKMNLSVQDVAGEILSISQFTLYADTKKGNRPGFSNAMDPSLASQLYDYFNECLASYDIPVKTGEFGADMLVEIHNFGPTTIILDSAELAQK